MTAVMLVSRRAPVVGPCPPPSASTFRNAAREVQQQDLLRLPEDVSESDLSAEPADQTPEIKADYKQVVLNEPLQVLDRCP